MAALRADPVGASLLAKVVNDDAINQMPGAGLGFFASKLAPTGPGFRGFQGDIGFLL
jgi:hypothetical protein